MGIDDLAHPRMIRMFVIYFCSFFLQKMIKYCTRGTSHRPNIYKPNFDNQESLFIESYGT